MEIDTRKSGILAVLANIFKRLPTNLRRRITYMVLGMGIAAMLETLALAALALFASSLVDPAKLLETSVQEKLPSFITPLLPSKPEAIIMLLGVGVVVLLVLKSAVKLLVQYRTARVSTTVDAYFGRTLLDGYLRTRYDWHALKNSADLVTVIEWRRFFGSGLLLNLINSSGDLFFMIQVLIALFWLQPGVTFVVILFVLLFAVPLYRLSQKALDKAASSRTQAHMDINRQVTTSLHGIKDIRMFGQEHACTELYDKNAESFSIGSAKLTTLSDIPGQGMEAVGITALVGALGIMLFTLEYSMARVVGILAFFAVAAWRAMPALSRLLRQMANLRTALPYVEKALSALHEVEKECEYSELNDILPTMTMKKSIQLDNVSFTYRKGRQAVIEGINLTIEAGTTVGLIGGSGAGKSTVVDLFMGLLEPTEGMVRLDGKPLVGKNRLAWVRSVGSVPQFPYIFDGTVADNIAFNVKAGDVDMPRVKECADMAAMEFLASFENGLLEEIGERGARLSGGQRQRVAIARALYNSPQILIFDEATSSLDKSSEQKIQDTIYKLKGRHTMLIVAHRLSTVEKCDTVVWLEHGQVKDSGPPSMILKKYREDI